MLLRSGDPVAALTPALDDRALDDLAARFTELSQVRGVYDQVRFIDADGMERVRVDLIAGVPTRITELQDKSHRYYFSRAIALEAGGIYISRLDLNIERHEIEDKPMIRLATPVVSRTGERLGVLVINYLAREMLQRLHQDVHQLDNGLYVVNEDGYWLHSPDAERTFGFMYDRTDATLAAQDPEAWAALSVDHDDEVRTSHGVYVASPVTALDRIRERYPLVVTDDGRTMRWVAYAHVSDGELATLRATTTRQTLLTLIPAMLINALLATIAAMVLGRRWSERFALREAAIVFDATADGVVVTNANLRVVAVNAAYSRITGRRAKEVVGHRTTLFAGGVDAEEDDVLRALETDGHWTGRRWDRRADGARYPQLISISLIRDEHGRTQRYVSVFKDISAQVAHEEELTQQATHDSLTQLANRAFLEASLERDLARSRRTNGLLALFFIDLDGFKPINDTYGHDIGDVVLQEVSRRLRRAVRASDTVARLGGDEFVVVLVDSGAPENVEQAADRILASLRAPIETDTHVVRVSGSLGIALSHPTAPRARTCLIRLADAAMYQAKRNGGDQWVVTDQACDEDASYAIRPSSSA